MPEPRRSFRNWPGSRIAFAGGLGHGTWLRPIDSYSVSTLGKFRWAMLIIEELYRLTEAFAANRLEYAVCGGLAVAIHGRPRLTVDIDVVVAAQDIARAAEIASGVGFDDVSGWVPLPLNNLGINRLYRLNKVSGEEFLTLDLLEANSSGNAIFSDRETFDVKGRSIQSLTRAALIAMKRASDRTKDRLDVELLHDETD